MRVVCISDTHGLHAALQEASPIPPGDVLVHAGDFTDTGARDEVLAFNAWLATLPHKHKIVIAGNHESTFDRTFYPDNWYNYGHEQKYDPVEVRALLTNALYLEDQAVLIDGFLFYGTPWQPEFCNWAFNLPRGAKLVEKWKLIPSDVDVLITHSPPMGRGDQVGHLRVGCSDLLHEVQTRIKPPYHVFGHVHEGYGRSSDGVTTFMNASSCTHEYEAVNPAMIIDLKKPRAVHDVEQNHAIRYDVMLHEQLRVCSQKPVFVPVATTTSSQTQRAHPHGPCHSIAEANARKGSLKEFSVDGTTAAMLFESTLKLRPVKAKQTRALRYLFHHGFKGAEGESSAVGVDEDAGSSEDNTVGAGVDTAGANAAGAEERQRERRRVSLSRRVTMAVINELPDATRDAIAPTTAELLTAVAADTSGAVVQEKEVLTPVPTGGTQRRARRDKTLHRREAVAKLATMVEEPEKEAAAAAEAQAIASAVEVASTATTPKGVTADTATTSGAQVVESPQSTPTPAEAALAPAQLPATASTQAPAIPVGSAPPAISTAPTAPVAPDPPAKECIMCKYKVPGHVHPAADGTSERSTSPPPPPPTSIVPQPTNSSAAPPQAPSPPAPPVTNVAADVPPATPAVECILCKYKVAGHVHPGAEPAPAEASEDDVDGEEEEEENETAEAVAAARTRAVGPKRLSSWF